MSGHYSYHPAITRDICPSCHCSLIMLPQKVAMYSAEDELVSLSTFYELLDEQQHYYMELIQQQERNYRAFLQMLMDTSSSRMDSLVREMQDLRNNLQRTKAELAEVKKQGVQNSKQAEFLAEGLMMVQGALDGVSMKTRDTSGGTKGKVLDVKQSRGGSVLRFDGRGVRGTGAKKSEPKAAKLVADLTDIRFEDFKVVSRIKGVYLMVWLMGAFMQHALLVSMCDPLQKVCSVSF